MGGMICQGVLYGIIVYVIDVVLKILFATESMFPESLLPNAAMSALPPGAALVAKDFGCWQSGSMNQ